MGWSPPSPVAAALLLLLMILTPTLQQSPCSPDDTILMEFDEFYGATSTVDLDDTYRDQYSRHFIEPKFAGILVSFTTIGYKDGNVYPDLPPDQTFEMFYNASGYYIFMKKGIDRDGPTPGPVDDRNSLQFEMICKDPFNSAAAYYHTLKIQINDLNDNAPQFKQETYQVTVSESLPVLSEVLNEIMTEDVDNGRNRQVEYTLKPASDFEVQEPNTFSLKSEQTPIIWLREQLDYDMMFANGQPTAFVLNITASDLGTPPRSSWKRVIINITDADDLGPVFSYSSCQPGGTKSCLHPEYTASIASNQIQPTGQFLTFLPVPRNPADPSVQVTLRAHDRDTLNDPLQCALEQTKPGGYISFFEVTTTNLGSEYQCNIRVIRSFDRSNDPTSLQLILTVIEETFNRYSERAAIDLTVTPQNLFPPTILPNFRVGYIRENAPVATLVKTSVLLDSILTLDISDPDVAPTDPTPDYGFSLQPGPPFEVTSEGVIILRGPLDFEVQRVYQLNITVTELDTPEQLRSSEIITVNVIDVNDNAPVVPSIILNHTLTEGNYQPAQFILSFQASDPDNTGLDYEIASIKEMKGRQDIDNLFSVTSGGDLTLRGQVSKDEVYVMVVKITDRGNPPLTTDVTVYVDVTAGANQPPSFSADRYTIFVSESVPLNSDLWALPASDPEDGILTYSITSSTPEANTFTTGATAGIDYLRNSIGLDRERIDSYNLIIRVQDPNGNSASTTVTVSITDANDNSPQFSGLPYVFTIREGQSVGSSVGTVVANDNDAPNTPFSNVLYSTLQANPDFRIDTVTGQITSRRVFDYEVQQEYRFTVIASDSGNSPDVNIAAVPVLVRILDEDDSIPVFEEPNYIFTIEEDLNGPSFRLVGSVVATDQDSVPNVVYQFVGNVEAFTISSNSGEIRTRQQMAYNVQNEYIFQVTTSDGAGGTALSASTTVTVRVLDINNYTPQITVDPVGDVTLLETFPGGTLVADCDATDGDPANTENSRVTFSIVNVVPSGGSDFFYIIPGNGRVFTAKRFTTLQQDQVYTITVEATDAGTNPSPLSAQISITVRVMTNTAPFFNTPGTTLQMIDSTETDLGFTVVATDNDPEEQFQIKSYTLIGDSTAVKFFDVVDVTNQANQVTGGRLIIRANLQSDPDLRTEYTLEVLVEDGAGATAQHTVVVPVNRNLIRPNFNQLVYSITIPETYPPVTNILTVSAVDTDQGKWGQLKYNIFNGGDATNYFFLQTNDQNNGDLRLKNSLINSGIDVYSVRNYCLL